ncbi:MAG: hypothetical protein SFV24_15985 [Gemmatimonadales bacterium]|nr:hypothetical protein [Gemmatimonadales bacterium]
MHRIHSMIAPIVTALLCAACDTPPAAPTTTPESVAAELFAADSGFGAAAKGTDVVTGLSAMFAADVTVPAPGGKFTDGKPAVVELLRSIPDNAGGRVEWAPIRVGISGDGRHGFTFGYGKLTRADSTEVRWKYLAYWIKGSDGWRVRVYRRGPRADGAAAETRMAPALPAAMTTGADSATVEQYRSSLDQAERGFSDEAQRIGLGPAFVKWGRTDAVNMGGPAAAAFVVGADSIGAHVGAGGPVDKSPVSWAPERVVIAASGDLGVTIGLIRPNEAVPAGSPPGVSFFTVWYRGSPGEPWRYIAE